MSSLGLRHQCLCETIAAMDCAASALAAARSHLSMDYRSDSKQIIMLKTMVSAHRRILAEKSIALRQEIDAMGKGKP
jgi:hypothetical protein